MPLAGQAGYISKEDCIAKYNKILESTKPNNISSAIYLLRARHEAIVDNHFDLTEVVDRFDSKIKLIPTEMLREEDRISESKIPVYIGMGITMFPASMATMYFLIFKSSTVLLSIPLFCASLALFVLSLHFLMHADELKYDQGLLRAEIEKHENNDLIRK